MYLTRLHAVHITVLSVVLLNLQGLAEDEQEVMAYANLTRNEHRGMRLAWSRQSGLMWVLRCHARRYAQAMDQTDVNLDYR